MFTSLRHSLYDLAWLKARRNKLRAAFGYAALFLLVVLVIYVIPLAKNPRRNIQMLRDQTVAQLPNFTATFKQGELTISDLPQPYRWQNDIFTVLVDTSRPVTSSLSALLGESQVGILITSDRFEMYDNKSGEGRVESWKNSPDGTINRAELVAFLHKLASPKVLAPLSILVFLVGYLGFVGAKLASLIIVCLIALVFSFSFKRGWQFKELFTVGLYALTLPTMVSLALFYLRRPVGWLHFLILLAFMLAVVLTKDQEAEASVAPSSSTPPSGTLPPGQ